jgi:uncharacterized protein (TIGR02611 family)
VNSELPADEERAAGAVGQVMQRLQRVRRRVHRRPGGARIWQAGIAVVGSITIIVGVILLVLPGPGWVVIFIGLGILATEFAWAKSLLTSMRRAVGRWAAWARDQGHGRIGVLVGVVVLVLAALAVAAWLLAA